MKRIIRWFAYVVVTLVVLLGAALGYVYAASSSKAGKKYAVPAVHLNIPSDSASLARGEHLVVAISKCVECHGDDLGGKVLFDDPSLGLIAGPNLTTGAGGSLAGYSDDDLELVIRHGIRRDGTSTLVMPVADYQYLTDDDVGRMIAYVRSLSPVDRSIDSSFLRVVGRILVATNAAPLYTAGTTDPTYRPPVSVVADTSLEYGKYLAKIGGCTGCHGPGLGGGPIPGMPPTAPPASNLTPTGVGSYSDAELETMLRTGKRPDATEIDVSMPWRYTALMSPLEMRATIMYIRSVPKKDFGTR